MCIRDRSTGRKQRHSMVASPHHVAFADDSTQGAAYSDVNFSPGTIPKLSKRPRAFIPANRQANRPLRGSPVAEDPRLARMYSTNPAGPLAPNAEYEFSAAQEEVFRNLVNMISSAAHMFFGMFVITFIDIIFKAHRAEKGAPPDVATASDAIDYMFYAYFLRKASQSFERVITTEGCDISNLMNGLNGLYLLFKRMLFVSTVYCLKVSAMVVLEFPQVRKMFKTPKSNLKSPLDVTPAQATSIVAAAAIVLTVFGAFSFKRDVKKLATGH
eukprot:TRINITY_DN7233_c0_g1_i1.p1 TRINITY_DN7233_c0_g1~~TRINITY_DN7233_c0_g1_i1.p1  ORF type:complete len:271 (-),score=41.55 TRINITY_DN7233_c0_g1_i1:99-911(-)